MPETEDLNEALFLLNAVEDLQRRMKEPSNARITLHRGTEVREVFEKINVVEKRVAKAWAGFRVFLPRPAHDSPKAA